jgi:hypothetical protein
MKRKLILLAAAVALVAFPAAVLAALPSVGSKFSGGCAHKACTLSFTVEKGHKVAALSYLSSKCGGFSNVPNGEPIAKNGTFSYNLLPNPAASPATAVDISGKFTSKTKATGTLDAFTYVKSGHKHKVSCKQKLKFTVKS